MRQSETKGQSLCLIRSLMKPRRRRVGAFFVPRYFVRCSRTRVSCVFVAPQARRYASMEP